MAVVVIERLGTFSVPKSHVNVMPVPVMTVAVKVVGSPNGVGLSFMTSNPSGLWATVTCVEAVTSFIRVVVVKTVVKTPVKG